MHVTVQLVQIGQYFHQRQYLPYSVGMLQAYCQHFAPEPQRYDFWPIIYARQGFETSLRQAIGADILALSVYIWNAEYSLKLAQRVKQLQPDTLIIMGGPQIPDHAEDFLRQHPYVDLVSHGEGEALFLEFLEAFPHNDWQEIAGLSYLKNGQFHYQPPRPRRRNLDDLPSPYLSGLFDDFMQQHPQHSWAMVWETNRGCPFTCSFCDWGSATANRVNRYGIERLKAEIDWITQHNIFMIFLADANFGILKRDIALTEYLIAQQRLTGHPQIFVLQSTKNVTERAYQINSMMAKSNMRSMVTLSMQSLSTQALKDIQRENISLDFYRELQHRFRRDGVPTYTDLLIGLPGESFDSFLSGLNQALEGGQFEEIRFFNTYILPNAPMADPAYRERYQLDTIRVEYVEQNTPTDQEIKEYQEVAVGSYSLSRADWRRCRSLAWWFRLLIVRNMLQLPLVLLRELADISYATSLQWFLENFNAHSIVINEIRHIFSRHIQNMEAGGPELLKLSLPDPQKGQTIELWHDMENIIITGLLSTGSWDLFFQEAGQVLKALIQSENKHFPEHVLRESLAVSAYLCHPLEFRNAFQLKVQSNFWAVYQGCITGQTIPFNETPGSLSRQPFSQPTMHLDWQPLEATQPHN